LPRKLSTAHSDFTGQVYKKIKEEFTKVLHNFLEELEEEIMAFIISNYNE
jgi:hypothetical protein